MRSALHDSVPVLVGCLLLFSSVPQLDGQHVPSKSHELNLFQYADDPTGAQDSLFQLSTRDKAHWAAQAGHLDEIIQSLQTLSLTMQISIKLIGFDGEGNAGVRIPAKELERYLQVSRNGQLLPIVDGETELEVSTDFVHTVSLMPRHIADELEGAIFAAVKTSDTLIRPSNGTPLRIIDHQVVTDIIQREHQGTPSRPVTLYILNPEAPKHRYAYKFDASLETCPGTLWADAGRFLWVDLTAGPHSYGPLSHGRGLVLPHSFPNVLAAAGGADHDRTAARIRLISSMAAFVRSASVHLATPPLQRQPRPWEYLDIRIIRIHDAVSVDSHLMASLATEVLQQQLAALALPGQSVTVEAGFVGYAACDLCIAAYAQALKTRTGRVPGQSFKVGSHPFLDAAELSHWAREYQRGIFKDAGMSMQLEGPHHKILPVFVFETAEQHVLLFEDGSQAAPAPDLVVAVATQAGEAVTRAGCVGQPVLLTPTQLTRPVLAALLTAGWGVSPPEAAGSYLFSVGQTPFGPLASTVSLSFAQKDAGRRNLVLAALLPRVRRLRELLGGFQSLTPGGRGLRPDLREAARRRAGVAAFKVRQALHYLEEHSFDLAAYFAASLQHDVGALEEAAEVVTGELKTVMQCTSGLASHRTAFEWLATIVLPGFVGAGCITVLLICTGASAKGAAAARARPQRRKHY